MIWYFLIDLLPVPPWSLRIRSRAIIRSLGVRKMACVGESGIQMRVTIPVTNATPPASKYKILYGATRVSVMNDIA
jgi:hypothetical protein